METNDSSILNISGCALKHLPNHDNIDPQSVTNLDISRNKFYSLPNSLALYSAVEELNCSHNCIRQMSSSISHLTNLRILDLSFNELASFPCSIYHLASITWISLAHNRLANLPDDLGPQLKRLQYLNVNGNQLCNIPNNVCQLSALKHLSLADNQITQLPTDIYQLGLRFLDVSNNQITNLPSKMYLMSGKLLELNLHGNPLTCPPLHLSSLGVAHLLAYLRRRYHGNKKSKEDLQPLPLPLTSTNKIYDNVNVTSPHSPRLPHSPPNLLNKTPLKPSNNLTFSNVFFREDSLSKSLMIQSTASSNSTIAPPLQLSSSRPPPPSVPFSSRPRLERESSNPERELSSTSSSTLTMRSPFLSSKFLRDSPDNLRLSSSAAAAASATVTTAASSSSSSSFSTSTTTKASLLQDLFPLMTVIDCESSSSINSMAAPLSPPPPPPPLQQPTSPTIFAGMNNNNSSSSSISNSRNLFSQRLHAFSTSSVPPTAAAVAPLPITQQSSLPPPHMEVRVLSEHLKSPIELRNNNNNNNNNNGNSNGNNNNSNNLIVDNEHWRAALASVQRHKKSTSDSSSTTVDNNNDAINKLKFILEDHLQLHLCDDLCSALHDGVLLCHFVRRVAPQAASPGVIHLPSVSRPVLEIQKCRRNLENFTEACRRIGVDEEEIFDIEDLLRRDTNCLKSLSYCVSAFIQQAPWRLTISTTPTAAAAAAAANAMHGPLVPLLPPPLSTPPTSASTNSTSSSSSNSTSHHHFHQHKQQQQQQLHHHHQQQQAQQTLPHWRGITKLESNI